MVKPRLSSVATSEVKCVAKACKFQGLDSKNTVAVGLCSRCESFEHYECSKTKQEERDDIQRGRLKYVCSRCFMKNPSKIALDDAYQGQIAPFPTKAILQVTSKTKAIPIETEIIPMKT